MLYPIRQSHSTVTVDVGTRMIFLLSRSGILMPVCLATPGPMHPRQTCIYLDGRRKNETEAPVPSHTFSPQSATSPSLPSLVHLFRLQSFSSNLPLSSPRKSMQTESLLYALAKCIHAQTRGHGRLHVVYFNSYLHAISLWFRFLFC